MTAYNFQPQFEEPILKGTKEHTIRPRRKNKTRIGQAIQLYTGMRTKHCKLIAEKTCTAVKPIMINVDNWAININGHSLSPNEITEFAHHDGFDDSYDFFEFFKSRYTTEQMLDDLEIICWGMLP